MKLCKNCTHFRAPAASLDIGEYTKCAFGLKLNPVTGDTDLPTQSSKYCSTLRALTNPTDCGVEAKWFQSSTFGCLTIEAPEDLRFSINGEVTP
jgi:hypothetical protein